MPFLKLSVSKLLLWKLYHLHFLVTKVSLRHFRQFYVQLLALHSVAVPEIPLSGQNEKLITKLLYYRCLLLFFNLHGQ